MLIGLLLALGCSVCYGTATVLQAAATRSVDAGDSDSGVDAALLLRALRQWRYLVGIGLDGLGFVLQVAALRLVPIYVVAAAIAASLAVTAIVAAWLLSTRLSGNGVGRRGRGVREPGDARPCRRARGVRARAARAGLGAAGDRRRRVQSPARPRAGWATAPAPSSWV